MSNTQIHATLVTLGQKLKSARLERNDSQKNFAFRIGVSVPTLHKMEQGSPQVSIGTWAKALDILDRLDDLDNLLKPKASLADRFATYQKTQGRQRASRSK